MYSRIHLLPPYGVNPIVAKYLGQFSKCYDLRLSENRFPISQYKSITGAMTFYLMMNRWFSHATDVNQWINLSQSN